MDGLHTYHCLCNTHLLTTTYELSVLPRRASPSVDKAHILPCPSRPVIRSSGGAKDYTKLAASCQTGKAFISQGLDGLEKKYPLACHRCGLTAGYWLDHSQFNASDSDQDGLVKAQLGRREDILYILPGAVVTTSDMKAGRKPEEDQGA